MSELVWSNTVDKGRFVVYVEPLRPYVGRLVVSVAETADVILVADVGVAYDAPFGADATDIAVWESIAIEAIDEWIRVNDGEVGS